MRRVPLVTLVFSLAAVSASLAKVPSAQTDSVRRSISGLSIPFVANEGQTDPRVAFTARTFAGTVFVTKEGRIVYSLPPGRAERGLSNGGGWTLTETFVAGNPQPRGGNPAVTRVGSFVGADPASWRSSLPTYEVVRMGEVWDDVAVSLRAYGDNVEKLFTVAAGASERRIRVKLSGALGLKAGEDGSLIATTDLGEVAFRAPFAYQERGGRRFSVPVAYTIRGSEYGFRLGAHDRNLPVVIDPIIQSTFLGGSGQEGTNSSEPVTTMSIHPTSGDVYVAGATASLNFPGVTGGAFPTLNPNTQGGQDAFVARLNASLTTLMQATYLGGSSSEIALAVLVHPTSGEVYVGGYTTSADFPETAGGASPAPASGQTGFVARLNAGLTDLIQATYAGGFGSHVAALAVRSNGEIYAAGEVNSPGLLPGTTGGAQPAALGDVDAFLSRFNQNLTSLLQSTYLGGSGFDGLAGVSTSNPGPDPGGIFVHPTSAEVYLAGTTNSTNLLATAGGAQPTSSGGLIAFISRLNGDLTSIVQATYLGGGGDNGRDIALHPTTGDVYVTGDTFSLTFPNTTGGAQAIGPGGTPNAYIARLNGALTSNPQSTYFGGGGTDRGTSILVHPTTGEVYAGGQTASNSLPASAGGAQPSLGGGGFSSDGYIVRANAALTAFLQSTYFGGSSADAGIGDIEIHPTSGQVYASGEVNSISIPGTAGGAQPTHGGGVEDSFVTRITSDLAGAGGGGTPSPTATTTLTPTPTPPGPTATPTLTPTVTPTGLPGTADLSVVKTDSPDPATVGGTLTYTILVTNNGPAAATTVTVTDTLPAGVTFSSASPSQGSCAQAAGIVNCALGTLANGASATVTIQVVPTATGALSNGVVVASAQTDPNPGNSGSTAGTTVNPGVAATDIPVLSPMMLALLGIALAGIGLFVLRRI